MCVCGLPEPTAEHAERMADFALGMHAAMAAVCRELLGVDSCALNLRVGIHSGTCVAGVLVGERARFQLFGDAVNTASRMESTGAPGRVQASEATARLLLASGMFSLQYRGKVNAKGKGELVTYWLLGRTAGTAYVAATAERTLSGGSSAASPAHTSLLGSIFGVGGRRASVDAADAKPPLPVPLLSRQASAPGAMQLSQLAAQLAATRVDRDEYNDPGAGV